MKKILIWWVTRSVARYQRPFKPYWRSPATIREPWTGLLCAKYKNVRACDPWRRGNKQFITFMAKLYYITLMVNLYYIYGWYYIYGFYYF